MTSSVPREIADCITGQDFKTIRDRDQTPLHQCLISFLKEKELQDMLHPSFTAFLEHNMFYVATGYEHELGKLNKYLIQALLS